MALMQACERLGFRYGLGLDYTVGSFYIGQGRPLNEDGKATYWPSFAERIIPDLQTAGVTNIEMETSGQLVVGYLHGMRMGAILSVSPTAYLTAGAITAEKKRRAWAAAEAMKILMEWDKSGKVQMDINLNR